MLITPHPRQQEDYAKAHCAPSRFQKIRDIQ